MPHFGSTISPADIFNLHTELEDILTEVSDDQIYSLHGIVEHMIECHKYEYMQRHNLHYSVIEDRRLSILSLDQSKKSVKEVFIKRVIYLRILEKQDEAQRAEGFMSFAEHSTYF